jgi:hypothetical protein
MNRKRRRRPGVLAARRAKRRADKTVAHPYTTRRGVPQIGFARWCAVGAPWRQTNLDPDIARWILRLMSEREAADINTINHFQNWIELHKPAFSWTTEWSGNA